MAVLFVSSHKGALEWIERQKIAFTAIDHLKLEQVKSGDTIIGVLPVHYIAQICKMNARYFHIAMNVPKSHRRQELTADEMNQFGAKLEEYTALRVETDGENNE